MKYDAFISYKHSELDMYVAKAIHKKLETFKVPHAVAQKLEKKKISRVFRDQEELPIGSDLADNILQALQESGYLIVICSPRTPESYWVQKEIDSFIKIHGRKHILAVLVEGEPAESFPSQLLTDDKGNPVEPLAADVRGSSKSEIQKKMRTEILRLAAALLGCNYDELRQRHRERKMKKAIWCVASVALLGVAFGGYSSYNAILIQKNYRGKQINQSKYLADTALSLTEEGDCITAAKIALEALPSKNNDRPYVANAQYALSEALHMYSNGNVIEKDCLLKHDSWLCDIVYSPDGTKLLSTDIRGTVYVWDVEKAALITKIPHFPIDEYEIVSATVCAAVTKENTILKATENEIVCFDLNADELWTWKGKEGERYTYCEFDTEAGIAAMKSSDAVDFINMSDGSHIGRMENTSETSTFVLPAVFNDSHDMFAVSHYNDKESIDKGKISVYDFKKSSKTDYTVNGSSIVELRFCPDGNIVVLSMNWKDDFSETDGYIEKIDISSNERIWINTIKMNPWEYSSKAAGAILRCRSYKDENTNEWHDEVLLSIDNVAYVWDSTDGYAKEAIRVTDGITAFLVSANSGFGYLVERSGLLNICNMTEGEMYSNAVVEIGNQVSDVLLQNGVLAARFSDSKDVMLMKYHEAPDMKETGRFDKDIIGIDYSADESYYAIKTESSVEEGRYYFYASGDDSSPEVWDIDNDGSILESVFINESVYAAVCETGRLYFYDVAAGEEIGVLEPDKDMTSVQCSFTKNNKYVFVYDGDNNYYMADLQKKEIISQGVSDKSLTGGVVTEDGSKFYGSTYDKSLVCIDTKTGDTDVIDLEGYNIRSSSLENTEYAVSSDGKLLAVMCMDNMVRILNTKSMKTSDEVELYGGDKCFIGFSGNNSKLIMQGDIGYYQVYDLKKHKFIYMSKEPYDTIQNMTYNKETNTICLTMINGMLILNKKDYEPLAYVDGGIAYLPRKGYVFNEYAGTVYRFPYMDKDMMIKEAEKRFGEIKLTEQERIQYNVD